MTDAYRQLLDATITHVQELKAASVRHLAVAPETLAALAAPVPRRREPSTPAVASLNAPISMPAKPAAKKPAFIVSTPGADAKAAAMAELRARVLPCMKCPHLASSRTQVVFGIGDIHAPLMFVGEAPGADEDEQGEPFIGKAGQLLTKIIQAMGLSRETVYIANILKCRPDTPGQTAGNRKPTPAEMDTCKPYLLEQIRIIQPRAIVALGATALEGLLGQIDGIGKLRGHWQEFHGTPLMPTYHPAYLVRKGALSENGALSEKRQVWEDMLRVMEKLAMPISEKQRAYFLKP